MNLKKQQRVESAQKRQAEYSKLSTNQKIVLLDMKLGEGKGAIKQRAKLARIQELAKEVSNNSSKVDKAVVEKKPYHKPKRS